jgi:hypothetical protein
VMHGTRKKQKNTKLIRFCLTSASHMASETTPLTAGGNDAAHHLRRLKSNQW